MPPPPTENLRVVKYAQGWGYAASEWERALSEIDWTKPHAQGGPERLKIKTLPDGTKDATVWRATLTLGKREHEVVLKVEPLDSIGKQIQSLLRRTKSFRQWRMAKLLEHEEVPAAQPLAVIRGGNSPQREVLFLESVPGPTVLEAIASSPTPDARRKTARAVAQYLRDLESGNLWNADSKPSNLIVDQKAQPWRIVLVDTVAIRREPAYSRKNPFADGSLKTRMCLVSGGKQRMLRDLVLESMGTGMKLTRTDLMRVLTHSCIDHFGSSSAERPWDDLWEPLQWRRDRRLIWDAVARLIDEHGDPSPKDDPLARG